MSDVPTQFMLGGETDEGDGADLIARLDAAYSGVNPNTLNGAGDTDGADDPPTTEHHSSLDEAEAGGALPPVSEPNEIPDIPEIPGNLPPDDPNAVDGFAIADEAPGTDHHEAPIGAPDPNTPPPAAPPQDPASHGIDLNEYAERVFDAEIGRQQMLNLLEFGAAVGSAPQHVQQAIYDMLYNPGSGQFSTSVPVHGDGGGGSPVPPAAAPPGTPPSAQIPQPGQFDWNDPDLDLDPRVAAHLQQQEALLAQQLEAARQREMEMAYAQQEQFRQQVVAGQEAAFAEFRDQHPNLSETDLTVMLTQIERTNAFNVAFQVAQDPKQAMTTALNQILYSDPVLSQRELAARAAEEEARRRVDETRQRKASGLSHGSAAPASSAPLTADEHLAAAVADLADLRSKS